MLIVGLLLLFIAAFRESQPLDDNIWLNMIDQQLRKEFKVYQITICFDKLKGVQSHQHYEIFKRVMDDVPTTMLDFHVLDFNNDSSELFREIQKDVTFYIVLHYSSKESYDNFKEMIDAFEKFNFYSSRPKILIMSFADNYTYEHDYERILAYAWQHKFLDFSVIEIFEGDPSSTPTLYYYNPFYDNFIKQSFSSGVSLFPTKLMNVNQYPLKLLGCSYPPFMTFTNETEIQGIQENELYFPLVVLAAESMNFKLLYIHCKNGSGTLADSLQSAKQHFINGDVNVFLLPSPLTYELPLTTRVAIEYLTGEYLAIVPILSTPNFMNMSYIGKFIITILLIIGAVTFSIKIFMVKKIQLNYVNIFQILLGMSAYVVPRKTVERIFFMCVTIIAMSFSTEFYSQFVNMNVIQTTTEINTYEDIVKSKLVPYINKDAYNVVLSNYDDPFIDKIKDRALFLLNETRCIELLNRYKNRTCIMYRVRAEFEIGRSWNSSEKQAMKIAKPVFNQQLMAYSFEMGSPYMGRFNSLFRRHFECGLWFTWSNTRQVQKQAARILSNNNNVVESEGGGLVNELISVLTFGYICAFIICLVEIIAHQLEPYCLLLLAPLRNRFPLPFDIIAGKKRSRALNRPGLSQTRQSRLKSR